MIKSNQTPGDHKQTNLFQMTESEYHIQVPQNVRIKSGPIRTQGNNVAFSIGWILSQVFVLDVSSE